MGQPVKSFVDIDKFFSKELSNLLDFIQNDLKTDFSFNEITPEIFIYSALENKDTILYKTVNTYLNADIIEEIHDKLQETITKVTEIGSSNDTINISAKLKQYLTKSRVESDKTKSNLITSDHVLLAILNDNESELAKKFKGHGLSYSILLGLSKNMHDVIEDVVNNNEEESTKIQVIEVRTPEELKNILGKKTFKAVNEVKTDGKTIPFCTNLNQEYSKGKMTKLIGREKEINEVFRVLGRKNLNNAILVGEVGVGKTQIVHGIASLMADNVAPIFFKNKQIWQLNSTELTAGTSLRGQLEERSMTLIKSLKKNKNVILFIDNIHRLISDSTKNDYDLGCVVSDILSDSDIQVIGATTFKGYKTFSNANSDLLKRIQRINISNVSDEDSYKIMEGIKKYYEDFHGVSYNEGVLRCCIKLSRQYITEKSLPASAIDIMDEVGSYKKMSLPIIREISDLNRQENDITHEVDKLAKDDNIDAVKQKEAVQNEIKNQLAVKEGEYRKKAVVPIELEDVYLTISNHTGIPIGNLKNSDKQVLSKISETLKKVIIGQDEAIDTVSQCIKRNKIGLSNKKKPIGSFLMIGPTGVGKTLLAKTLAKEIFGDEKFLIRFDMSEYSDKTAVNKLIGSSAGYVGYQEGGLLTEAVKKQKYAVLLIDEIEKANEEIFNLFLQVLDEGFLTDNMGEKVSFKNVIIILTSNVGTKKASSTHSFGFDGDDTISKRSVIEKELKNKFPPEFINRLDEIVYFNSLTDNDLKNIIKLELTKMAERTKEIGFDFDYSDDTVDYILTKIAKEKEYGARPIMRIIRNEFENKITNLIIDNDLETHEFKSYINNGNLIIT